MSVSTIIFWLYFFSFPIDNRENLTAIMGTFKPILCTFEDYRKYATEAKATRGQKEARFRCVRTNVRVDYNEMSVVAQSLFLYDTQEKVVYLNSEQVSHFSDPMYKNLYCEKITSFFKFIKDLEKVSIELPFTAEAKKPVYLPLNRSTAAGVILSFFNGLRDPLEKIISLYGVDTGDAADEINRILVTITCVA